MNMTVLEISASAAVCFFLYARWKWVPSASEQKTTHLQVAGQPEEIKDLGELSHLWLDNEIEIQSAARLWRNQNKNSSHDANRTPFTHEEIEEFYLEIIADRSSVQGERLNLIMKILNLLDTEGDCPSVVRKNATEAEIKFSDDSYAVLEKVPLYKHTITVTRNFIAKATHEALMADIILIALSHDIGKLPKYHNAMYQIGDHPSTSCMILKGMPDFVNLPNKDDILRAVGGHHLLKTDNILTDGLKLSDQEARESELSDYYTMMVENSSDQNAIVVDSPTSSATVHPEKERELKKLPPEEQRAHPIGIYEPHDRFQPIRIDTPAWFDASAILVALKDLVNVVVQNSRGEQWVAVSTNQGLVLVKPEGLWQAIKVVSGNDPKVKAAEGFESEKRNIIYTVYCELSKKRGVIARQYVSDSYYTTQVSVISGGGNGLLYYLIPFKAHAFGEIASTFEERKTTQFKRMVSDVVIKQKEIAKCV